MKFHILTLFPEFFESCLRVGLLNKAIQKALLEIQTVDVKQFSKKGRADDYPFGGGDGMLIAYEPLKKALKSVKKTGRVIYLSAQGDKWTVQKAKTFSKKYKNVTLVCGRYGGVDSRFIQDFVDEEISIGDYVLNGGESASLVLIETCSRFLKGFLGNEESYKKESFEDSLLEGPGWTKPRNIKDHKLPEVILSGNHKKIEELRFYSSLMTTWLKRPELLEGKPKLLKQMPMATAYLTDLPKAELKALGFSKKGKSLVLFKK
ncbi:MAG: tRNA (guanosine(37)-N1)-methyltransferase TrmD [Oligoflexia bacterium]|nr:tRNA (guanosine(37)-N1)-methyltransferase TrmD [Oligoflexia bacterium]